MLNDLFRSRLIVIIAAVCNHVVYTTYQGGSSEDILCRMCGEEISNIKYAHIRLSPGSILVKNQTDFGRHDIPIQVLANPSGMKFNLMTLLVSSCSEHGSWQSDHSWFPGFMWKVCLCPRCHQHLGWIFDSIDSVGNNPEESSPDRFHGLNVDALISSRAANSHIHSVEL